MGSDGEAPWIPTNPTFRPFSPIAFGFDRRQSVPSDPAKLFVSPASFDSFSRIGPPPVTDLDNSFPNANDLKDLWKRAYERVFSQDNTSKEKGRKDPAKDSQYRELQIDAMSAHKDQELDVFKNAGNSSEGLDLKM